MNYQFQPAPHVVTSRAQEVDALAEVLFRPMGVDGVYARTAAYEAVIEKLSALINFFDPANRALRPR